MTVRRQRSNEEFADMLRRMLRSMGRRAAQTDPEDLALLVELRDDLDAAIDDAVGGLKASGFTWQSISEATGTSRQAAFKKWGHGGRRPATEGELLSTPGLQRAAQTRELQERGA